MTDPRRQRAEAFINLGTNGALERIDQRAERARELRDWSLHPQAAEPGSSLAADNAAFEATYPLALAGSAGVTEEAIFPAMLAAENLHAAALLVDQRSNGSLYATSTMQLSRTAMESSARTIWLLSAPERGSRIDRCLSLKMKQFEEQKRFLKLDAEQSGRRAMPAHLATMNAEHRRKQAELVQRLKDSYTVPACETFSKTVSLAAKWVDEHVPVHDAGELEVNGLAGGAASFYSWGSSFVHGYKWAVDYTRNGGLFRMIADSLAAAINMTECAVALFEASRRAPANTGAQDHPFVPSRLEPTIAAWGREMHHDTE